MVDAIPEANERRAPSYRRRDFGGDRNIPLMLGMIEVGRAIAGGDELDAGDDIAERGVVVDAANAPAVIDMVPLRRPSADPARQGLVPFERTADEHAAEIRRRWSRLKMV